MKERFKIPTQDYFEKYGLMLSAIVLAKTLRHLLYALVLMLHFPTYLKNIQLQLHNIKHRIIKPQNVLLLL